MPGAGAQLRRGHAAAAHSDRLATCASSASRALASLDTSLRSVSISAAACSRGGMRRARCPGEPSLSGAAWRRGGDAPSRPKGLRSSKPLAPPTNCPCPALHYGWPMQHGPSPWQSLLPRRACVEPSARLPLLPLPAPRRRFSASMPLKAASPGRCSGSPVPGAAGNPPARTPALSATAPPPPLPTPAGMVRGLRFGMPIMLPGPHDARILHSTTSFVKEFCGAPISRHHVGEQAAPRSPHNMHTSHLQAPSLPKKP